MRHWINLLPRHANTDSMARIIEAVPFIEGFMLDHDWSELEPSEGRYNFSLLLEQMDFCADKGLRLACLVRDKSFFAQAPNPVPSYLPSVKNRAEGSTAVRWAPEVRHAFTRLLSRLSHLDRHPGSGGFMLTESAPSIDAEPLKATGYSTDGYAESYREWLSVFPTIRWQLNFGPMRDEKAIYDAVASGGFFFNPIGGPDVLPNNKALVERTYPLWKGNQTFATMSMPSYSVEGMTIEQVAAFAERDLEVKELFWTYTDRFEEQTKIIRRGGLLS